MSERKSVGDMKSGLTSSRPKMSVLGRRSMVYQTRGTEYGAAKYARGNFRGPAPDGVTPEARVMGYVDALMRHCSAIADAYNRALGTGGDPRAAIGLVDDEASGGFPASGLPHLAHILAGAGIAVECAVDDGLLPEDPGQPWASAAREDSLPQKDDPAAERTRVATLRKGTPALPPPDLMRTWHAVGLCAACGKPRGGLAYTCGACEKPFIGTSEFQKIMDTVSPTELARPLRELAGEVADEFARAGMPRGVRL